MNFDDALKHYAPRAWFRFKFLKYKYAKRGEPEIHLIRHLVEPGTTAIDIGCSIGIYAAEMARYAGKVDRLRGQPRSRAVRPRGRAAQCRGRQCGAVVRAGTRDAENPAQPRGRDGRRARDN